MFRRSFVSSAPFFRRMESMPKIQWRELWLESASHTVAVIALLFAVTKYVA